MSVVLTAGEGGLPRLGLSHPSGSTAEVYLHGGHVTSWVPAGGTEALFVSRSAVFEPATAIRGGVPVIFPQFGKLGPLPKHGFARMLPWRWVDEVEPPRTFTRAVLRLDDTEATRALWPHRFLAELTVDLAERSLSLGLSVRNVDARAFSFTAALHTYLRLGDVREAGIRGLQDVPYRDRMEGQPRRDPDPELSLTGEIDRVYFGVRRALEVRDRTLGRTFHVRGDRFSDVVIWNPWKDGAAALPDMDADEHRAMVCVEAAQVGAPVHLVPGMSWRGAQRIEILASDEPTGR